MSSGRAQSGRRSQFRPASERKPVYGEITAGLGAAFPIALGYFPIAVSYGVLARQAGIDTFWTVMMSVLVYAGASQFMAVNLVAAGAGGLAIVIATLVLNLRHFIMSASLSQRLGSVGRLLPLVGFGVTDETFVVNSLVAESSAGRLTAPFVLTVNFFAYLAWVLGSWIGSQFTHLIPGDIAGSLEVGLYAMFIGLLVPAVRKEVRYGIIALIGALASWGLGGLVSDGWALVGATVVGAAVGVRVIKGVPR